MRPMRQRVAVLVTLLTVLAGAMPSDAHWATVPGNKLKGIGGWLRSGGSRACAPWPTGVFAYIFDADDLDNNDSANSAYADGAFVSTWQNDGGATTGDADSGITTADTYKPTLEKSGFNNHPIVAFDGVADHRRITGSAAGAGFIHNTGTFDVFFVMRTDSTLFSAFAASTVTTNESGILWDLATTGSLEFRITRGVGGTYNLNHATTYTLTPGAWATIEARGDGTTFRTAKNFGTYETSAFDNKPFTAGDATNVLAFGAGPTTADYPFDGAFAVILIASAELSATNRTIVRNIIGCRYGI